MVPYSTTLDKTNCLSNLVGIRSSCSLPDKMPPFFIEDIDGFNIVKLSNLAQEWVPSGQNFGNWVVGSAAREMMGDLEALLSNGFSMEAILGQQCSACDLLPVYTANTGIIIKAVVPSRYKRLQITRLTILANVTGTKTLVIDNGVQQDTFQVMLQAGVKMPVNITYETLEPQVKIFFQDSTIGLGQVLCPSSSSCGCGGSATSTSPYSVSGLLAGVENATQFGFIPCASVGCSYDSFVCNLVNQAPNLFGLALLYKVGEKLLIINNQSDRNNQTASFNDTQDGQIVKNYGQLYWAKLQGAKGKKGIKDIVSNFLATQRSDKCVVCDSKIRAAFVTG